MSVEEDVELRDLVAQTLESNGCLAKIRAQLRASLFLALDEDIQVASKQPLMNNKIKTHLESPEGQTMFCIVREFLEYFNLCYTISVYDAETYLNSQYKFEGRQKLVEDLELEAIEDTTVPVLLQLIKIAQTKTKVIEINMNVNGSQAQDDKFLSQEDESDNSNIKTDESNSDTQTENKSSSDDILPNNGINDIKCNKTFDINSPMFGANKSIEVNGDTSSTSDKISSNHVANKENSKTLDTTYSKKDDTFENTSSINEDSIDIDNNEKAPELSNGISEDISITKSSDKSKLSHPKSEKVKSKMNLSSLSDLPPLQINKSRGADILPSLYSKEFKEKSNLRELDKLFDMEVEYEEDFMCSGDELSLKSDYLMTDVAKLNLVDEQNSIKSPPVSEKSSALSMKDVKRSKSPTKLVSDSNKPIFKTLLGSQNGKDTSNNYKNETAGSSSIYENIDH